MHIIIISQQQQQLSKMQQGRYLALSSMLGTVRQIGAYQMK